MIQPLVTAPWQRRRPPGCAPPPQFALVHRQREVRVGRIQLDDIAITDQRQRPAGGRFGRDMQDDRAEGRPAHARVG